jgi:hypothetical protein
MIRWLIAFALLAEDGGRKGGPHPMWTHSEGPPGRRLRAGSPLHNRVLWGRMVSCGRLVIGLAILDYTG